MPGSAIFDIRALFGAAFIGLLVSATLFGVTIVQAWIYFWQYQKRDSKALKLFVAFVTVMDGLHTIICAYAVYWYLVLNFGNAENLDYSEWAMSSQIIFSTFVGVSVQLFYARRVYIVSQSIVFPSIIVVFVALGTSFAFLFFSKEIKYKRFSRIQSFNWITYAGLTSSTLADLMIAAGMCLSLYRKRTGFARTDSIIMTLMAYSIHSGLLTSLLSVASIISLVISPTTMIWLAIFWAMCKCYINSLLAMLNSRDYVRDRSTTDNPENAYNLSSIRIEPLSEAYGSKFRQPGGVAVAVHRSTTSDFAKNKSNHDDLDVEPDFEVPKPDARHGSIPFQSQGQISESST